jgi:putative transposase
MGVTLVAVDPRDTSRTCPCCGLVDKRNRPTRDRFRCIDCGHEGSSDITAAVNIARKGAAMVGQSVMLPYVGFRGCGIPTNRLL